MKKSTNNWSQCRQWNREQYTWNLDLGLEFEKQKENIKKNCQYEINSKIFDNKIGTIIDKYNFEILTNEIYI